MPLPTHFLPKPLAGSNVHSCRQKRMHTVFPSPPPPPLFSEAFRTSGSSDSRVLEASGNKGGRVGGEVGGAVCILLCQSEEPM